MVPVVIMGVVQGPIMLIKVLIAFVIEQTIEGRFLFRLWFLGSKLSISPDYHHVYFANVWGNVWCLGRFFLGIPILRFNQSLFVKEIFLNGTNVSVVCMRKKYLL